MNWFTRTASDRARVTNNIVRLETLRDQLHDLAWFGIASGSGGHMVLEKMLNNRLVLGRPRVHEKLTEALIGENNQKVALDAPNRFQQILLDAEALVDGEIGKERRTLRQFDG